jgi:hypothetical protein
MLTESRVVLSNFVNQYFHHIYAVDHSPVFLGAGDIFVIRARLESIGLDFASLANYCAAGGQRAPEIKSSNLIETGCEHYQQGVSIISRVGHVLGQLDCSGGDGAELPPAATGGETNAANGETCEAARCHSSCSNRP